MEVCTWKCADYRKSLIYSVSMHNLVCQNRTTSLVLSWRKYTVAPHINPWRVLGSMHWSLRTELPQVESTLYLVSITMKLIMIFVFSYSLDVLTLMADKTPILDKTEMTTWDSSWPSEQSSDSLGFQDRFPSRQKRGLIKSCTGYY